MFASEVLSRPGFRSITIDRKKSGSRSSKGVAPPSVTPAQAIDVALCGDDRRYRKGFDDGSLLATLHAARTEKRWSQITAAT